MTETTFHRNDAAGLALFDGRASARVALEFRRARRHSRLVKILKFGLPLTALGIVAGGLTVTWLARSAQDQMAVSTSTIENGHVVMEDPRMSGSDKNGEPYSVIARRAIQSLTGGGIDLEMVRATLSAGGGRTADIVAKKGHFEETEGRLRLYDDMSVEMSDGTSMRLKDARIDLSGNSMAGDGPVEIRSPNHTILAGNMLVEDGGAFVTFSEGVKMTLIPSGMDAGPDISESDGAP